MNKLPTTEELIKYLKGLSSQEEKKWVDDAIKKHPELEEELDLLKQERNLLELDLQNQLKAKMDAWENETSLPEHTPAKHSAKLPYLLVAIVLLVLIGYYFKSTIQENTIPAEAPTINEVPEKPPVIIDSIQPKASPKTTPTERISSPTRQEIAQFRATGKSLYTPYEIPILRSTPEDSTNIDLLERAEIAYQKKQFVKALQTLEQIKLIDSIAIQILTLKGHAHFQTGKYLASLDNFEEIIKFTKKNELFLSIYELAQWNKILCLTQLYPSKKIVLNNTLAEILEQTTHSFYQETKKIKEQLYYLQKQ